MSLHETIEKRYIGRLLCDDNFSGCTLHYGDSSYSFQAINFHHEGLSIFGSELLHSQQQYTISFNYHNPSKNRDKIEINRLACIILHSHQTDAGNQYGIKFVVEAVTPDILTQLLTVEGYLREQTHIGDRYGLFT